MAPQRDNRVKVFAFLRAEHKVNGVAKLVGLPQPSTQSRSAWAMMKVSIDVQVGVEIPL